MFEMKPRAPHTYRQSLGIVPPLTDYTETREYREYRERVLRAFPKTKKVTIGYFTRKGFRNDWILDVLQELIWEGRISSNEREKKQLTHYWLGGKRMEPIRKWTKNNWVRSRPKAKTDRIFPKEAMVGR